MTTGAYLEALEAIDAINARDPNQVVAGDVVEPLALAQGRAGTRWVRRLTIHPSEVLLVAARAHHLGGWGADDRTSGDGQSGHLASRSDHASGRANDLPSILGQVGYGDRFVDSVRSIIETDRPRSDRESQAYEDAVALASLEMHFSGTVGSPGGMAGEALLETLSGMTPEAIAVIPELPGVPEMAVEAALRSAGRTDLGRTLPLAWDDQVAQANNLIHRALTLSEHPVITVSGQLGGVVLLHLVRQVTPSMPVLFTDTGYHFPETVAFIEELARTWNLNLKIVAPQDSVRQHEAVYGGLYETDRDACCALRKVGPSERALAGHDTWFSAVRRDQSPYRSTFQAVTDAKLAGARAVVKVNPLVGWSWEEVERYAAQHGLPRHPLYGEGYSSIGCAPCTSPTFATVDDRRGRWAGAKVECGLHLERVVPT